MFEKYKQLTFSLVLAVYGTAALLYFDWPVVAVIFYLGALFFLYSYFAFGPVFVAFGYAKAEKFDAARSLLDRLAVPRKAGSRKEAYYFLTRGLIQENLNELSEAEASIRAALNGSGLFERDEALAYLKLAAIHHLQGREESSLSLCRTALKYKAPMSLSNTIETFEKQLVRASEAPRARVSLFDETE